MLVHAEYRVGDATVRDNLYRTLVVVELLLRDDVGVVAVYRTVYADDVFHDARDSADVVRNHHDCHFFVQPPQ